MRVSHIFSVGTVVCMAAGAWAAPIPSMDFQAGVNPTGSYVQPTVGIRSDQPTTTAGTGISSIIGTTTGAQLRTLFSFDLSALPVNATITGVTLTLRGTGSDSSSSAGLPLELRQLTNSFDEASATWSNRTATASWSNPGGDFVATQLSTATINASTFTSSSTLTFSSTSDFVAAAQSAFDNHSSLNLIAKMIDDTGSTTRNLIHIATNDNTTATYLRPKLTVEYSVPEPTSFGFLSIGALVGLSRRKRRT